MYIFLLIISIVNPIQSMHLEVNGKVNLGRNWHQGYRAKEELRPDNSNQDYENPAPKTDRDFRSQIRDSIVKDIKLIAGTNLVELLKHVNVTNIVSNLKIETDSPTNLKNDDKIYKNKEDTTKKHKHSSKKHKRQGKEHKSEHEEVEVKKEHEKSHAYKKSKSKHKTKIIHDNESKPLKIGRSAKTKDVNNTKIETTVSTTKKVKGTEIIDKKHKYDIYLKPFRVKDDPQLVDHIKHIHAQSLKVINDLKTKTDNYKLKKDIDVVMRSYDEKYKEFVKENKYHMVKSRLGKKKVILNAADMSNKILNRLVTYVRSRVEASGLRSGVANVFHTALQSKVDLENKRMCKKFAICRSGRTFRHFLIDMFTIVLNSNDEKVQQFHNAVTETFKTRDLRRIMHRETARDFRRGIRDLEAYDLSTTKASYFIIRNILDKIHEPIKVTNQNSKSVNKTVAFIDFMETFDEKIPPNEKNKLEWDDMLNSFRQWSKGERKDVLEIFQTVMDHIKKAIDTFDDETANRVEHNLYTMIN